MRLSPKRIGLGALALGVVATGVSVLPTAAHANTAGTGLVINEVYGAGGNSGSVYNADFVELYNPTSTSVSLSGTYLQYRSATGGVGGTQALTGSVAPTSTFLVQMSTAGTTGAALPTPNLVASPAINLATAGGQVILGTATTYGSGNLAGATGVIDMLGASGATSYEGTAAGAATATQSLNRTGGKDTDVNSADFALAAPSPTAGSSTTAVAVTNPGDKTAITGQAIGSFSLAASGGTSPYTWSATGLPNGVTVSSAGLVSGTPTTAGTYSVTATATDSANATGNTAFKITVTDGTPTITPIAQIQGTNATASPLAGQTVTTQGVVTAAYPTGGLAGYDIQTGGTGGATDATPGASDAVFVYAPTLAAASFPKIGDSVQVTGAVSEFNTLTELTANTFTALTPALSPVTPLAAAYPTTDADREAHESELLAPTDTFTVTNSYSTNQYGEIGLATGTKPLIVPTEVADAQDTTAVAAVVADNAKRAVTLDDASSVNFLGSTANKAIPLPWLTASKAVSVGARATFKSPVILDYRNSVWKFEPRAQVTGDGSDVATFSDVRAANAAPQNVGGNVHLATFNVENFFPTTADAVGCTSTYNDRDGNPITANDCGTGGVRGAANDVNFQRQQAKTVAGINKLTADVVTLEEIENSVKFGKDRDDALGKLVTALNAAAGAGTWAYVPSPDASTLPALSAQDVIRTAFIYKPAAITPVGTSKVLVDPAFSNARQPLAQAFKRTGAPDSAAFAVIVNHFKSKGSGTDDGTGQGLSNQSRIDQANALVTFAKSVASSVSSGKVFLTGDFNAYTDEDPIQVLQAAGFTDLRAKFDPDEFTYSYSGQSGSLDHVFANAAALGDVTGADVWNINSVESVAYAYSRYNYNVTNLYNADQYAASDHDPEIVGLTEPGAPATPPVDVNLLNINDFHGRIDGNTTKFATTIEQLRAAAGEKSTLFLSDGDNLGASLFASAIQKDQPTIDVLNALGLQASAVGNHEFDQGFDDLNGRIKNAAQFPYLGANVYLKGTQTPALPEYKTFTVNGVTVGVIGAVTQETPALVSPSGIANLDFGDPVAAVNRVAAQLTDGNAANGEADVLVAEYHEGAGANLPDTATCAQEIAADTAFGRIARNTSAKVGVIFTGHTHKTYACDAPVPGSSTQTRPILQTGSYGENIGQVQLKVDPTTKTIVGYTQRNVARVAAEDLTYPRVAQVKQITDAAIAYAAKVGNQPVGRISDDITTAFTGGNYTGGFYGGTTARDDRASESTLGDLVAQALKDGVSTFATPDLGITNPGGLRNELYYAGDTSTNPRNTDGVVTYAEANSVLPFNNTVAIVKLTGAQLKQVLEQQWQTNPDGTVPSRPYLQLGLSDNVRVTADPSAAAGSRITSVRINGTLLDPSKTYTVSTLSFLASGGDNFRAFTQGTSTDTGLLDAQLWRDYLANQTSAKGAVSPDYARQQVEAPGLPASVTAGQKVSFTLNKLNLTSLGSPLNTQVTVFLTNGTNQRRIGSFPVSNGSATVQFTAPANLQGSYQVGVTAIPSGTQVGADGSAPTPAYVSGTVSSASGPVSGACVYLYTSRTAAAASFATCTNADGTYTVGDVDPGTYEVAVADPSGVYKTQFRSTQITVTSTGVTGVDFTLTRQTVGTIKGTLTDLGSGAALNNVCVYAYQHGRSDQASYAGCTDSTGAYTLSGVEAGSYDLAFYDPSRVHPTQWFTGSDTVPAQSMAVQVTVAANGTVTANAALYSSSIGTVQGTVTAAGSPTTGVCVYLYNTANGATGRAKYATCTAADGTYYFGNVAVGSYKVAFAADDFARYATQWYTGAAGGASSYTGGATVTVTAGKVVTGIDAAMATPGGTRSAAALRGASVSSAKAMARKTAAKRTAVPATRHR